MMKDEFIDCFARHLAPDDVLVMPEPVYFGGTTDAQRDERGHRRRRRARRPQALALRRPRRLRRRRCSSCAQPGDRIVVMGARDDTLTTFAGELLSALR